MRHCIYKNVAFVYNEFGDYMIEFTWNNVAFLVTDIGGGVLGKSIPRHAHALNCYELHFIINGRGELETDDRVYHLKRGDFFITGPNYCHAQSACVDDPVEDVFFLVQARDTKRANAVSAVFLENTFSFHRGVDSFYASVLLKEYRERKPDYQSAVAGLAAKILTDSTRLLLPHSFSTLTDNENLNDRRFAIIEQAFLYDGNLTLSSLSRQIGLCPRQTQRLLKKYYGKCFRDKKKETQD